MAWNKNITKNQMSLGKAILSLFIIMAITSCAGTNSPEQTKGEENPNLVKVGTPVADSLAEGMPEFARSVFKGVLDSVPEEYYYHATNGRIDALLQKEGKQYKTLAYIIYDSPNGQIDYEIKNDDISYRVKNGVLVKEFSPNYYKEYWNNGKIKALATGLLYKDDNGIIQVDSGHSEIYFENGEINQQNDWNGKLLIAQKEWDEKGTLIKEFAFPKYVKVYWNNGKIKQIGTGLLYRGDQGNLQVDSGHSEIYYENGKIKEQNDWKDKQPIAHKLWNEDGMLVAELDFPKNFKGYWDNGNLKNILTGHLYRDDQDDFALDSGHSEIYFENGKIMEQNDWKDKLPMAHKLWNENGVLIKEFIFPKYYKEYWDNGNIKGIMTGSLYRDGQTNLALDSGHSESYFENGKINEQNDWKDKLLVAQKEWNEKGTLIKEFTFPKYYKIYYENGKLKHEWTGQLYWSSSTNTDVENGFIKEYYENGKLKNHTSYKDKQYIAQKQWNEKGILTLDVDLTTGHLKSYNENGTIHIEMNGYTGQKDTPIENGNLTLYFNNGKPQFQEQYKEYKTISKKMWYENGNLMAEGDASKGFHKEFFENGKISRDVSGKFHYEDKDIILENGSDKRWYENGKLKSETIFPKYSKIYFENGTLGFEIEGILCYSDQNKIMLQNGFIKQYYENGQIKVYAKYKEQKKISRKMWYENGNLQTEFVFPKYEKYYYENGTPSIELEGTLYYDDQDDIQVQDGFRKDYYENKKLASHKIYKERRLVGKTEWHEDGNTSISVELPNHYKEFYDNGKIKVEATGTIVEENESFKIKDGIYKEYSPSGEVTYSATYKDFQIISEKK
jgi:antitoxin component YwqK of YwqJK toxin-antitoxin module